MASYLGGIIDGEGSFSGFDWWITQSREANPIVHAEIKRCLTVLGLDWRPGEYGAMAFRLRATRENALKLLTWCRPVKPAPLLYDYILKRGFARDKVVSVENEPGEHEVVWLETTTGNYVAGGYASKNSRLHRIGQKNSVQIIDYIARNTIDLGRLQAIATKWQQVRLLLGDITKPEEYSQVLLEDENVDPLIKKAARDTFNFFGG